MKNRTIIITLAIVTLLIGTAIYRYNYVENTYKLEVAELITNKIKEDIFVIEFQSYIIDLERDWKLHYDDEVLREYIKKKLHIVNYKHNCDFYGNNLDISNILLAIEDLEDLEYEYKEKLLDSGEAIKIFKYEFKYKLRERKKNLE